MEPDKVIPLTDYGMTNVFGIDKADDCDCQLFVNTTDIGAFGKIYISKPKDSTDTYRFSYITLTKIEYFEGKVYWRGANFQIAPEEECVQFLTLHGIEAKAKFGLKTPYLLTVQAPSVMKMIVHRAFYYPNGRQYSPAEDMQLLQRISVRYATDGKPLVGIHKIIDTLKNGKEIMGMVRVEQILERFEAGESYPSILADIPWLESEDIQACLVYARQAVLKQNGVE